MAVWYRYSCQDCGYGGLTKDRDGYRQGRYVCPSCGSLRFDIEDVDAAPLPEEEERDLELDD